MSKTTLRAAAHDDAPAVAAIWEAGWREAHLGHVPDELVAARTPASFLARAGEHVDITTVAVVDGAVGGFVMVVEDEVEQVYVDPSCRGTPVAADLLAEAERQIRATGHASAWLAVVAGNLRARRFYERQGWVDEGLFDHQAPGGISVPAHRYVKRL
ncbi:N-acetyltransferase [Nocardioides sp. InS609-2]|uniref:GNAT family N-acetyltransferase n=1 Tax=Nocardioides sp. InS609-2 TaxID=2760705 RepID=UPI0020C04421|nr:N-acetyltransferase [Nocardioides sp. InS609-2]